MIFLQITSVVTVSTGPSGILMPCEYQNFPETVDDVHRVSVRVTTEVSTMKEETRGKRKSREEGPASVMKKTKFQ